MHHSIPCLLIRLLSLTEIAFDDALKQAKELDEYYRKHRQVVGPLHGLPITLKDQFNLKGYDSTIGYVYRAFNPATEDAVVVRMLKQLGAIVLAKSNLPQSIMVRLSVLSAIACWMSSGSLRTVS